MTKPFFVFDLDDTLYLERDYSVSALRYLGRLIESELNSPSAVDELLASFTAGEPDAIGLYWQKHRLDVDAKYPLVERMRAHHPEIKLFPDSKAFLQALRQKDLQFAIVTDGRSVTQRAKIAALGLTDAVAVAISEESGASKPHKQAFSPVLKVIEDQTVIFVGDNPLKDFVYPNQRGWETYMRKDNGQHVHKQSIPLDDSAAAHTISDFSELASFLHG